MFSNNHNIISRDSTQLRHFLVTLLRDLWAKSRASVLPSAATWKGCKLMVGFNSHPGLPHNEKRFKKGRPRPIFIYQTVSNPNTGVYRGMHLLPRYARRATLPKSAAETWEKCCFGSKTAAGLNAARLLFKCAIVTRRKKVVKRV